MKIDLKNEKNNHKVIAIKIIISIIIFFALVFLLRNIIKLLKDPTDIFLVENGTLSLDETREAYIIRNEIVLSSENNKNGMEKTKTEGKKVASGDTVFRYYSDGENEIRNRIDELTKQIDEAQKNEVTVYTSDIDNLKKEIKGLIEEIYETNNIEKIEQCQKQIDEYTNKISKIIGENSPEGSNLKNLIDERNANIAQLTANSEDIIAPCSGTVSYRIDKLEDTFPSDNFDYLSKDYLDNLDLKTGDLIEANEESGKIINDFFCYLAVVSNSDASMNAKVGDRVKIGLDSDEVVSAKVQYIKDDGDDRIIVFAVDALNESLINYRKISVNIVWWEYTGLKIPNSAIIYDGDLAYIKRNRAGYEAKVLVKVIKSNESYSLVDNYTTDELKELGFSADEIKNMYNIKLYDKIKIK